MTKKITTKDYVYTGGNVELKTGTYDCLDLWTGGYSLVSQQLVNKNLVITTDGGRITLLDYVTASGTTSNSYKYVKDDLYGTVGHKGEVKELGVDVAITNLHLIDEFYAVGTTVTGTVANDTVDVSGYVAKDGKTGLTINSLGGDDDITGTAYSDRINVTAGETTITEVAGDNVIVTGADDDDVTVGTGNDTVTLGKGNNVVRIDASKVIGNNVINLTKDEHMTVTITNDVAGQVKSIEKVNSDVVVTLYGQTAGSLDITKEAGTITFKGLGNTDVTGAAIAVNFEDIANPDIADLRAYQFTAVVNDAKTSFSGTYLSDDVAVTTTKNGYVYAAAGDNEIDATLTTGAVTVTSTTGNDTVYLGEANTTLTLGTGNDELNYDMSTLTTMGKDVFNVTKDENLTINITEALAGQVAFGYVGNDLVISAKEVLGKVYEYKVQKFENANTTETVTIHKTETSYGGARVASYQKIVTEHYETDAHEYTRETYEYQKRSNGKWYWVMVDQTGVDGAAATVYKAINPVDSTDAESVIAAWNADAIAAAKENTGKTTYLKTVQEKKYTAVDTWTNAGAPTVTVSTNTTPVADVWEKVTTYTVGAETVRVAATSTDLAVPVVTNKTWQIVSVYDDGEGDYVATPGKVVAAEDAGTTYNVIEVNKADSTDTILVVDRTADVDDVDDYYGHADDDQSYLSENYGDAGQLTLKNFKSTDYNAQVTLNYGTDLTQAVNNMGTQHKQADLDELAYNVELGGDGEPTSFSGTYVNDNVTAAPLTTKALYVYANDGDNTINLSNSSGKNTITAGKGNDDITGGANDDTITPGAGENTLRYNLNNGVFGNDRVTVANGSTVNLIITENGGLVGNQVLYSRTGNDIKVTALGGDLVSTYNVYTKIESAEHATYQTGYKYATSYSAAHVTGYIKTEIEENYTAIVGGVNDGKYEKVKNVYNLTAGGWVLDEGESNVTYSNTAVEGSETYERNVNGVKTPFVWDEANKPTDFGTTYTKTLKEYSWNGTAWAATATPDVEEEVTSNTPVADVFKVVTHANAGDYHDAGVFVDTEDEAQLYNTATGNNIYLQTLSTHDAVGAGWTVTSTKYDASNVNNFTRVTYTKHGAGEYVAGTPTTQNAAFAYENYNPEDPTVVNAVDPSIVLGTVTLVNGATAQATLQVGGVDIFTKPFSIVSTTGGTLNGTDANDTLQSYGGSSAIFNSLAGNDTIFTMSTSNTFNYTLGKDTITSSGTTDVININKAEEVIINGTASITRQISGFEVDVDGNGVADIDYTNTHFAVGNPKVTISDRSTRYNVTFADDSTELATGNNIALIKVNADNKQFTDNTGRDVIVGDNHKNAFKYLKGGTDIYRGGTDNDSYTVGVSAFGTATNRLFIEDAGGANDKLNLDALAPEKLAFYFDVDATGNNFSGVAGGDDNLAICDKSIAKSFNDAHVVINDYNTVDGKVETVTVGNQATVTMDTTITAITTAVQGWLVNHNFASTIDVMENGNQYDQASLTACFNNAAITTTPLV